MRWALTIDLLYALGAATLAVSGNLTVDTLSGSGNPVIDMDTVISWCAAFVVCFMQGVGAIMALGIVILIAIPFLPCRQQT